MRNNQRITIFLLLLLISLIFNQVNARENVNETEKKMLSSRTVNHYFEANLSTNVILTGGDRLKKETLFASGFHIAHGSDITPVHALVMSLGKDFINQESATLTSATFFLRRYMPKHSTPHRLFYSTIGSAYYRYEKLGTAGVLENAGLIIGFGSDFIYSKQLRFSLEADYRGFNIRQFGSESKDYIRPFTLFAGFKYYYLETKYSVSPQ